MNEYISLSDVNNPIIINKPMETTSTVEQFLEQENGDISQLEIIMGEVITNTEKISSILTIFIDLYLDSINTTVYSYDEIMYRVLRSKEKEKDLITSYLKDLTEEERKVDNTLKNNQLDRWSKGLQKGLVQYVKETYDDERENLEKIAIMENKLNKNDYVTDMNRDIYMFDLQMEQNAIDQIEAEEYDMSHMHNDDDYDNDIDEEVYDTGNREFLLIIKNLII